MPVLLPVTCPLCGAGGPVPCGACRRRLRRAGEVPTPGSLDACRALVRYEGAGRDLVSALKYRGARRIVAWLAREMATLVDPAEIDLVTFVPTSAARRRRRGFDQAELLARGVGSAIGRPTARLLRRRRGPPQTGQTRPGRLSGPRFGARSVGGRVLVVDDVVTTGATMTAAGAALRREGAAAVAGLAAAHTPPPPAARSPNRPHR